jgi:signal transduction histidine kinase
MTDREPRSDRGWTVAPRHRRAGVLYGAALLLLLVGSGTVPAPGVTGRPLLRTGLLLLLAAALPLSIRLLLRADTSPGVVASTTRIPLAFGAYGVLVGGLVVAGHLVGPATIDWRYTLAAAGLGGLVAGVPVGRVYVDLTRTRRTERRQVARLERATRRISVLYRVLRHNLRTEVNVIVGYLDLLDRTGDEAAASRHRRTIRRHVTRLEALVQNVKRLRQVWETEERRVDVPIRELVVPGLGPVAREYPDGSVRVEPLSGTTVRCHPLAHWAVEETLRNALEHNDPGTTAVVVRTLERNERVVVEVTDDGRGLSSGEIEALRSLPESQLVHGQGLGLQIVYWLTEGAGGALEFDVDRTEGTTVRMAFPAEGSAPGTDRARTTRAIPPSPSTSSDTSHRDP